MIRLLTVKCFCRDYRGGTACFTFRDIAIFSQNVSDPSNLSCTPYGIYKLTRDFLYITPLLSASVSWYELECRALLLFSFRFTLADENWVHGTVTTVKFFVRRRWQGSPGIGFTTWQIFMNSSIPNLSSNSSDPTATGRIGSLRYELLQFYSYYFNSFDRDLILVWGCQGC